jgi:hypothetical protein
MDVEQVMKIEDNNTVRRQIVTMLASGLGTEAFPRPNTNEDTQEIIRALQKCGRSLEDKIVISGFTLAPITHNDQMQFCKSCIYYLHHHRHCNLPELNIPVEPEWSCRLWRL